MSAVEPVRIGVLGCGNVSPMYLPNLTDSPLLEVVAVGDVLADKAKSRAEEFSIPNALTPEALLASPDIELVVNLTPIRIHREMTAAGLAAGKHVYSEKSLTTQVDEAVALVEDAGRAGLALGCAPDTLLGSGFQAAHSALRDGKVGKPIAATAVMLRGPLGPGPYGRGSNPFFDMVPYYASALVDLFGPVQRLTGVTRIFDEANQGRPVSISGTLECGDVVAHLTLAWGAAYRREVPAVTVFGTEGVLQVPNPNNFGDPAFFRPHGSEAWEEIKGSRQPEQLRRNLRGLGVAEMAAAIRQKRPPRASGEIAAHVVDVIGGLVHSAETGQHVRPTTTCRPAEPLSSAERAELLRELSSGKGKRS